MKKTVRIKWTKDEEEEVCLLLKENFQKGIIMSQTKREAVGLMHKRYWDNLKKKVSHMITKHLKLKKNLVNAIT